MGANVTKVERLVCMIGLAVMIPYVGFMIWEKTRPAPPDPCAAYESANPHDNSGGQMRYCSMTEKSGGIALGYFTKFETIQYRVNNDGSIDFENPVDLTDQIRSGLTK